MRIQTAPAAPPRSPPTATQTKPAAQQPVDSFQTDKSAAASMAKLGRTDGPVSGEEMRKAILQGIKDFDSHGASSELSTIQAWGTRNAGRLTTDAKEVLAAYAKVGNAARNDGQTGLTAAQVNQLEAAMSAAARPSPGRAPSPSPTPSPTPKPSPSKGDRLAYALANPNEFFKRQGYSAKYNPRPDELKNGKLVFASSNGNCGPTSLAMALKVFGLEDPRVANNPEDSIDYARNAMTIKGDNWDTLREPGTNDDGVREGEILRGARRLGLDTHDMPINRNNPLNALDAAFAKGRMVILCGQPGQPGTGHSEFEQAMRTRSGKTDYAYDKGHAILVMGKDAQGRYLVADPLSRKGVVAMTAREMASFEQWSGAEVSR